jgi:rare lipoprotein A
MPSPRVAASQSVPKGGGVYKVGNPYRIAGRWYVPREVTRYDASGTASWYGTAFHGRRTANGETYDMYALSAGHPTLPLPSYAYVTNLDNDRTVLVRINDRGPYVKNRMIDLSWRSAHELGYSGQGLARVRVQYAGPAPLDGNDTAEQRHLASQTWYRGAFDVAQNRPSQWSTVSTGAIVSNERDAGWSFITYREGLRSASADRPGVRRDTLGGPERSHVDVGPFASEAEAERMRHELEPSGPATVERIGTDTKPAFQVRVGPLGHAAAVSLAERISRPDPPSQAALSQ